MTQKVAEEQAALADYLGKLSTRLSIIYRARKWNHFLGDFPRKILNLQLAGTAMPRVGIES